jgi:hypothetical protein
MPRKEKPMPRRREKPAIESATYTTAELVARYHMSRRTLRRMSAVDGYPEGIKRGKTVIYAKVAVHDWEKKHMPSLHSEPEKSEDDKHWDRLRRRYLLEKEEGEHDPPPPKPSRPSRAARV